ncbi:CoA-binding protein [Acidiplasma cupricumulans]|uniref:CoA-binding protein n=1 Tax=Acidiplasma cupricumulans TaxID=312540 RepID=UPI000AD45997|nr:CoA-binding protein [Acidiplasma cupricumulans]
MIESLFRPESIAVVGASNDKNKVGNIIFRNIISTFNGKIFAVNTNGSVIENYQSYKSLKDIKEKC